jgi:hypothetical protein
MSEVVKMPVKNYTPAPNPMIPTTMDGAVRLAKAMSDAKMLPDHLRGSPGDCLMVVEQAMRWNMSPFAVAQCTSSVKGKLMFEGKLVAAAIEESGAIIGLIDYQFSGEGENRRVTVSATRKGETEPKTVEVVLKNVATNNEIWKKQPDQQLCYSGVRVWGRRWTPGVMLGVYSDEEYETTSKERDYFNGETIDGTASAHENGITRTDAKYGIQTAKELREYPSLSEWRSGWEKAVKAYVAANAYDKLEAMRDLNTDLFREIAETDPHAVKAVRDLVAMTLGEAPGDEA